MKKKFISILVLASYVLGISAFAETEIIPSGLDENNKSTFTIRLDSAKNEDQKGMLAIYRSEISDEELKNNNVAKADILMVDIITIPSGQTELEYVINMNNEEPGLYYAKLSIAGEYAQKVFSYMDKEALDNFLTEFALNTNVEDCYQFFVDHGTELMTDIENDYSSYSVEELKYALNNVISREYIGILDIKTELENGLLIVDINKAASGSGIEQIVSGNLNVFDIDIGDNSIYSKLEDKDCVWDQMFGCGFKRKEDVKKTFDEIVNNQYVNSFLTKIRQSTPETILGVLTDEAVETLGIEKEGIYNTYIKGNDKAEKRFSQLYAGSDFSSPQEASDGFESISVLAAYQTLADYVKYTELISSTEIYLSLTGNYFTYNLNAKYEVTKLMIANSDKIEKIEDINVKLNEYAAGVSIESGESGRENDVTIKNNFEGSLGISGSISTTSQPQQTTTSPVGELTFYDLQDYKWAEESIYQLSKLGIVHGVGNNKFEPGRMITKEEFSKMLVGAFEISVENPLCELTDVDKSAWYYEPVSILYSTEIVRGIGDGLFGTGVGVLREDMCVMLYNVLCYKGYEFSEKDEKINFKDAEHMSRYAETSIEKLQMAGVVNGVSSDMFEPKTPTNRAMAATVIVRVLKLLGKI